MATGSEILPHDPRILFDDKVHVLVGKFGVEREGNFVEIKAYRIWIILCVKTEVLVGGVERQGLVMDVASDAGLGHFDNDFPSLRVAEGRAVAAEETSQIKMSRRGIVSGVMVERLNSEWSESLVKTRNDLLAAGKHAVVAGELGKAYGRHDIGHVALVIGGDDVILPHTGFVFVERVLALAVEREQLQLVIDFFVVEAFACSPGQAAALAGGEVFDRVPAKCREVGDAADHLAVVGRSEGVRGVSENRDSSERLLQLVCRMEERFFALKNLKNSVVVAGDAAEVDRNDRLCVLGDRGFERVVVDDRLIFLNIDENQFGAHVADDRGRRGIGVGRDDHLVVGRAARDRADAHEMKRHFLAGGLRIEANATRRAVLGTTDANPVCDLLFKRLDSWSRGDPARAQSGRNFGNLGFGHIGWREGNITRFFLQIGHENSPFFVAV